MLSTLKVFCPIFSHLDVTITFYDTFDQSFTEKLAEHTSSYCQNVPQQVTVFGTYDFVGAFKFQNTTSVTISEPGNFENFVIGNHFPHIEHLRISGFSQFVIHEHLPNLKYIELGGAPCTYFNIREFGKGNPQLRGIKRSYCEDLSELHEMAELFPQLESLHLVYSRQRKFVDKTAIQSVRFPKVKQYTVDLTRYYGRTYGWIYQSTDYDSTDFVEFNTENVAKDKLLHIEFDRLETLKYATRFYDNLEQQIDFVVQYNGVKSLDFSELVLSYGQMKRLTDSLPKLTEITLRCDPTKLENILQFMNETALETIHVLIGDALRDQFLQAELPGQWFLQADNAKKTHLATIHSLTYSRIQSD